MSDLEAAKGRQFRDLKPVFPFEVAGVKHYNGCCWCQPIFVYDLDSQHKPIIDPELDCPVGHWVHTNDRLN